MSSRPSRRMSRPSVGGAHEVRAPAAAEARGLPVVLLCQDARELQHARVVGLEALAVAVGQRAGLEAAVLVDQVVAGGRERDRLQPFARVLQPVRLEPQLPDDPTVQLITNMRAAGDPEALRELARDGGAADLRGCLEHDDFAPGAGEVSGAGEAVVAAADDDDAIPVSHPATPPERCSGGAGPSGSRARRSRPARP